MLDRPKRLFGILGALAVLFIGLHFLGSSGTTEGDPGIGQQIANISTPLLELTILAIVVLGIAYLVKRRRRSSHRKEPS